MRIITDTASLFSPEEGKAVGISVDTISKLPEMYFTNITGGEPFIRDDLKDIVRELYKLNLRCMWETRNS